MKKKRTAPVIATALLAIAAISALWYARPLTIEELCPGLKLEECVGVYINYSTYDDRKSENGIDLLTEENAPLLGLFQGRTFSRSPFWWLPRGTRSHRWGEGDFRWSIDFAFQDVSVADDSTASGYLLHFNNFFGDLDMEFMGKTRPVSTADQEQWLKDVLDCVLALEPNDDFQQNLYN